MRPNTGQLVELLVRCTARGKHGTRKIRLSTELTMMGVKCKDSTLTQIWICGESIFRTQTGNLLFCNYTVTDQPHLAINDDNLSDSTVRW